MKDWCLEVWGDYACFTRPEMKVERVSYDVMTPSAARAIYEAILWKPSMRWHISRIEILNPIKWISVRRNEVGKIMQAPTLAQLSGKSDARMGFNIEEERQQRAGLFLRDVHYRIYAQFELLDPDKRKHYNSVASSECWAESGEQTQFFRTDETEAKYAAMFERRARKGQCFHRPYLGCREFSCDFRLVDPTTTLVPPISDSRDLGFMLYDMNFDDPGNIIPLFFKAEIKNGVVQVPKINSGEVYS